MWYTGKNQLKVLFDPSLIEFEDINLLSNQSAHLKVVLRYLTQISTPIKIEIFYPKFLRNDKWERYQEGFLPEENLIILEKSQELIDSQKDNLTKAKNYLSQIQNKYLIDLKLTVEELKELLTTDKIVILKDAIYLYQQGGLGLLDNYFAVKSDYLVTNNKVLLENREKLKNEYKIWIVDFFQFFTDLEIFLKGNGVYIEVVNPSLGASTYGFDVATFYFMTDRKVWRYNALWYEINQQKNDKEINNYFRVFIFHRYSFLRYAVDQIKFNLQLAERIKEIQRYQTHHYFLLSYHLNSFYIMIWGILDNLAWIFNHYYKLGFTNATRNSLGFDKDKFRKSLKNKAPEFYSSVCNQTNLKWIKELAIKRHPAAHREPLFLTTVFREGDEKPISDRVISIEDKAGHYLFDGIKHMELDLEKLHLFLDNICDFFKIKNY